MTVSSTRVAEKLDVRSAGTHRLIHQQNCRNPFFREQGISQPHRPATRPIVAARSQQTAVSPGKQEILQRFCTVQQSRSRIIQPPAFADSARVQ